jgi:protein-tyrosine phosphatase
MSSWVYERQWDLEINAITDKIHLSGTAPLAQIDKIKQLGIKLIICCCDATDVSKAHGNLLKAIPDLKIIYVPLDDHESQDLFLPVESLVSDQSLPSFPVTNAMDWLVSLMWESFHPTLVHCWAGISRSVSVVCYYLMVTRNMSYTEAIALVKSKRAIAQPNDGFEDQLINHAVLTQSKH